MAGLGVFVGIVLGAFLMLVFTLRAISLRERYPERYTGVWRYWGESVGEPKRAVLLAAGAIVGGLLGAVFLVAFRPTPAQTLVVWLLALTALVVIIGIGTGVAVYDIRRRLDALERGERDAGGRGRGDAGSRIPGPAPGTGGEGELR
ncbi:MAG TPA: hypothetical protein VFL91_00880 [Thermomicrobiales bacterium]|nr:hypothetical protein [Thermomicrobiales bacterium]